MKIDSLDLRFETESKDDIVARVILLLSFVSSDIDLNFDRKMNFIQIYHLALDCLLIALKFEVSLCLSMRYLTIRTTAPQIAKPNSEPTTPTTMYCFILAYRPRVNLSRFISGSTFILASRFSSTKSRSINASQQVSIFEHLNRAFSIVKLVLSSSRDSER